MTAIPCIVPFCGRSTPRGGVMPPGPWARVAPGLAEEWVCGDHWKLIPLKMRQVWGRYAREWRRYGPPNIRAAVIKDYAVNLVWWRSACRVWGALKRAAIERAVGVA